MEKTQTNRRIQAHFWIVLTMALTLLTISACSDSDNAVEDTANTTTSDYAIHIEPILYANCVSCHRNGGIGPFSLLRNEHGYQNAVDHASGLKFATSNRTMPPYLANNDGSCKTFEHARWLEASDIQQIANWVDSLPRPAEDLSSTPEPQLNTETPLINPSKVATMSEYYTPTGQPGHPVDDYRCFIVDPGWNQGEIDQLLTAFEVEPGNARLVHHIILFNIPTLATEQEAERLDGLDTPPGYTCFGDSGIQQQPASGIIAPQMLAGWAPGKNVTHYPVNTGVTVTAGRKLIMQVHYNLDNFQPGDTDKTSISLNLTEKGGNTAEAWIVPHYVNNFSIPPGGATINNTVMLRPFLNYFSIPFSNTYQIHGVFPHMHTHGISIRGSVTQNNTDHCLMDVPDWDFEWQQFFFYDSNTTPTTIGPDDEINISCEYSNNTGANIVEGEGTGDEMCLNFYYLTPVL